MPSISNKSQRYAPFSSVVVSSSKTATGTISTIGSPRTVTSMVSVVPAIPLPARSDTAPSPMARVAAVPTVSVWVALRVALMVVSAAVLVVTWSRVTLPCCPEMINPV